MPIGCNLLKHPGISTFYKTSDAEYWAFSERVYILTNAEKSTVEQWVNVLEPSEVDEGYAFGVPPIAPKLITDYKVFSVWWD